MAEMTQGDIKSYNREQRRLARAAEKELADRKQLESTRVALIRTVIDQNEGSRGQENTYIVAKFPVWLSSKRPGDSTDPTLQKKARISTARKADPLDIEERESEKSSRKAATAPRRSHRAPAIESEDSSSLSEFSASDDDDVAGENDKSNLSSMTDDQLERLVGQKNVIVIDGKASNNNSDDHHDVLASSLFSIPDHDVNMVPSREPSRASSRAPSRASSRASGPPTSDNDFPLDIDDYEGASDGQPGRDDSQEEMFGSKQTTWRYTSKDNLKGRKDKRHSKHEEKFEREQPKINAAPQKKESQSRQSMKTTKNDADDDSKWPEWTHIQYSKNKAQLKPQHSVICGVVHQAIELAEIDIVTKLAWPEMKTSREIYRRQILHRGAKAFAKEESRANDVKERVKGSMKYSAALGDLVMNRLSLTRSPARTAALSQIACFELGTGERCQQRVTALVENDLYIYPGTWQMQEVEEKNHKTGEMEIRRVPIWVIERSRIYQNPGFMLSLKEAFFEKKGSFGFKHITQFKSTLAGREECELTIPIVALGATGFFSAIHSWSSGSFNKTERFEGDAFNTTFERHVKYLEQIKEDNHVAFHVIMSRLYDFVTQDPMNTAQKIGVSNALSVVDLSGYE